jgi:peptide/nickel transport system ATP-binding protein
MSALPQFTGDDALTIAGLSVAYRVRGRERDVLDDLTLSIGRGEAYGLVGESGCGKSTAALAIVRYLPGNGQVKRGNVLIDGHDMLALSAPQLRRARASLVSMVYQDPARALNPALTIGVQVAEAFEASRPDLSRRDALAAAAAMLARVRIASPERVLASYPHQLSGGMQQRVVIAMALACEPALLILDEPTTGLDATVEAEVLDLIDTLRRETSMAVLFISHNLAVIGRMCERVGVLYAGKLVEEGASADVFARPRHPYTVGLLRCLPDASALASIATRRLDPIPGTLPAPGAHAPGCIYAERCALARSRCRDEAPPPYRVAAAHGQQMSRCHFHEEAIALPRVADAANDARTQTAQPSRDGMTPVVRVANVSKTFVQDGVPLCALDDVSLDLRSGETLGLVGESGSGKTTLAKLLLGVLAPDPGGTIEFAGAPLPTRVTRRNAQQIDGLQIVFQNPDSALNRSHSAALLIGRALTRLARLRGAARDARAAELADAVRLPRRYLPMRARQLSGGLKQRVAIARAFAGDPRVVVCDEPTSALDVSVQAAILNLLADLQRERGVSYLFISHDLAVVRYLADRIAVLYLGRLVEIGPARDVFDGPQHPYTEALLSSAPRLGITRDAPVTPHVRVPADAPGLAATTGGCVFHPRCSRKLGDICEREAPPCVDAGDGHTIRCHIPLDSLRALAVQRRSGHHDG